MDDGKKECLKWSVLACRGESCREFWSCDDRLTSGES